MMTIMKARYRLFATIMAGLVALGSVHSAVFAGNGHSQGSAAVDSARLRAADREPDAWMRAGRTYDDQRFSPLTQINAGNAASLGLAWYSDLDSDRSQEATPIMVDGVLYISTAWSKVKAFDAKSGRLLWEFDPKVPRDVGQVACCDVPNRGVAVWKGRVYVGGLDGRLIALDAATGKLVWSTQTTDPRLSYTITQAPLVAKGMVVIGNSGAEYNVRGFVSAYDADSGKLKWRFYTVPGAPGDPHTTPQLEAARKTWSGEFWKSGGGGTVWDGIHFDPVTDMIYFGTGNAVTWAADIRSPGAGDNLFTASVIAVDVKSGAYRWHQQLVPSDEWDYDVCSPLMSADLMIGGRRRHVLMQAPKTGFFYIWDAKTGETLSANAFAPQNWATGIDLKSGRAKVNPAVRYGVDRPAIIWPAPQGAHNWHPISFSPRTGLVYLSVTEQNAAFQQMPAQTFEIKDRVFNTGVIFTSDAIDRLYAAPGAPKRGLGASYLQAWDPVKGQEAWRAAYPEYGASGTLVTAGGLVFAGNHGGDFTAYDARSGRRLWAQPTQSRVLAAPSTYMVDGQQYVALLVGGRGPSTGQVRTSATSANNSRLLVYKLGGTAQLPNAAFKSAVALRLDPPLLTGSTERVIAGQQSFGKYCAGCHGVSAVADKAIPDLRFSPVLHSLTEWKGIVLGGARSANGMVSFKGILAEGEEENLYHYVISEANKAKAADEASKRP